MGRGYRLLSYNIIHRFRFEGFHISTNSGSSCLMRSKISLISALKDLPASVEAGWVQSLCADLPKASALKIHYSTTPLASNFKSGSLSELMSLDTTHF